MVETVAHTEAGMHFYDNVDVICDVGGQDIKIIILKNGRVKDFKLNTQCSAGNGYFLQSTAQGFNVPVEQYADTAFGAKGFPSFGYGCAVFMQSDIVDFQRQGWKPEEIMAGLCNVLPKNIWLYVSQIPNLSAHRQPLPAAGRHAVQSGRRQGAGRFHRVALQRQGSPGRRDRSRALRRSRRHRRGSRGRTPLGQRPHQHVHRPRSLPAHPVQDHAQRSHALLLLQEQVPAHLHRRQDQPDQPRLQAPGQDQGAARSGRAAADHRHLRKGHGREHRGDAPDQGRPRQGQEGQSELRRDRGQGRVPRAGCPAGGRRRRRSSRSPPRRRSAPSS